MTLVLAFRPRSRWNLQKANGPAAGELWIQKLGVVSRPRFFPSLLVSGGKKQHWRAAGSRLP